MPSQRVNVLDALSCAKSAKNKRKISENKRKISENKQLKKAVRAKTRYHGLFFLRFRSM